jgi:hypothetical protein
MTTNPNENVLGVVDECESAVGRVVALAHEAAKPMLLDTPGKLDQRVYEIGADGKFVGTYLPPSRITAWSLEGFVEALVSEHRLAAEARAVQNRAGEEVGEQSWKSVPHAALQRLGVSTRVYVSNSSVVGVICAEGDRQDRVTLDLSEVPSFSAFLEGDEQEYEQADLVWRLRSDWAGNVSPASFLGTVRKLKVRSVEQGQVGIDHGSEHLDLSIEREIAGVDDALPEQVTISTPVYDVIASLETVPVWKIPCAVRINFKSKSFTLRPSEGATGRAQAEARTWIANRIAGLIREELPDASDRPDIRVIPDALPS